MFFRKFKNGEIVQYQKDTQSGVIDIGYVVNFGSYTDHVRAHKTFHFKYDPANMKLEFINIGFFDVFKLSSTIPKFIVDLIKKEGDNAVSGISVPLAYRNLLKYNYTVCIEYLDSKPIIMLPTSKEKAIKFVQGLYNTILEDKNNHNPMHKFNHGFIPLKDIKLVSIKNGDEIITYDALWNNAKPSVFDHIHTTDKSSPTKYLAATEQYLDKNTPNIKNIQENATLSTVILKSKKTKGKK